MARKKAKDISKSKSSIPKGGGAKSEVSSTAKNDTGNSGKKNNTNILIIALVVIFAVEAMIVVGLWDRFTIANNRAKARSAVQSGNYDKALHHYSKLYAIAPLSATVNREMANAYRAKGDYESAIKHYKVVLDTQPNLVGINADIGLCYIELGRKDDSLGWFENELKLDKDNKDANFYVGESAFEKGDIKNAADHFQRVAAYWKYKEKVKEYNKQIEKIIIEGAKKDQSVEKDN